MVWLYIALGLLVAVLIGGYIAFYIALVRRPTKDLLQTPYYKEKYGPFFPMMTAATEKWTNEPFEAVEITAFDGIRLYGRLYDHPAPRGTVILMHGYRATPIRDFACALDLYRDCGLRILAIDQRACGNSGGRYIGMGVLERHDAASWAWYLHDRFGANESIFMSGLSMGAATVLMATSLKLPENVRGITADCGYSSGYDIIAKVIREDYHLPAPLIMPLVQLYCRVLGGFQLDDITAADALKTNTIPILFIHGVDDAFVPCYMTEQSHAACASEKTLVLVEKADHGMSYLLEPDRCATELRAFFDKHAL